MLDFQINSDNFLVLFGAYFTFFVFVYGISHAISLLTDRIK